MCVCVSVAEMSEAPSSVISGACVAKDKGRSLTFNGLAISFMVGCSAIFVLHLGVPGNHGLVRRQPPH